MSKFTEHAHVLLVLVGQGEKMMCEGSVSQLR